MDSRTKILEALSNPTGNKTSLPDIEFAQVDHLNRIETFKTVLRSIGGAVVEVNAIMEIQEYLLQNYPKHSRIVSPIKMLQQETPNVQAMPHTFETVDVMILGAHFGVAENGAVWITDELMVNRVLPFICQHLVVVLPSNMIVSTLHDAYSQIGNSPYAFGTFIAGPSKTADIEQSLVLGAHGPKTMTVFLMQS